MIRDLFKRGTADLIQQGDTAEAGKSGKLRGGNTAMLTESGRYMGKCAMHTYLRYKGVQVDDSTEHEKHSRELMFSSGRANEDQWMDVIQRSWNGPGQTILREEEIPTSWETKQGVAVTGRPDMVLLENEKPIVGIELKQVMSLWTARDVRFQKMPKLDHMMQAAHYSWQVGVPFELWYTNRTDFAITGDWPKNLFPQYGEAGYEDCVYSWYEKFPKRDGKTGKRKITEEQYNELSPRNRAVEIIKIKPFVQGYLLDIDEDGWLWYADAMHPEGTNPEWHKSEVSIDRIKRYYESIPDITKVTKEPLNMKPDGSKMNWKASDYCSLGEFCCKYQEGREVEEWLHDLKLSRSE